MEFVTYVSDPSIERSILLDPKENDVVAVQYPNLRDVDVNKRYGGMHNFAAEALQTRQVCALLAAWPQMMEVLETAMSELATSGKPVKEAMEVAPSACAPSSGAADLEGRRGSALNGNHVI